MRPSAAIILFSLYLHSTVSAFAVSNTVSFPSTSTSTSSLSTSSLHSTAGTNDIAIVGCGVLGTSLCKQLLSSPDFESTTVTAITKTRNNHQKILDKLGSNTPKNFNLVQMEELSTSTKQQKFTNVVFCAPPSGSEDYPATVKDAVENLWAGSENGGTFVFTSSGGIYGPGDGNVVVNELTPLPDTTLNSARPMRLVNAEKNVLFSNGIVLRLAGLYNFERGAHNYWLEKGDGTVKGSSEGIINLLHYDDAAGACIAALKKTAGREKEVKGEGGLVCLISDGNPSTRGGICVSAMKAKRYAERSIPTFGEDNPVAGKVYDGSWSNTILNWEPRYESFDKFMMEHSE